MRSLHMTANKLQDKERQAQRKMLQQMSPEDRDLLISKSLSEDERRIAAEFRDHPDILSTLCGQACPAAALPGRPKKCGTTSCRNCSSNFRSCTEDIKAGGAQDAQHLVEERDMLAAALATLDEQAVLGRTSLALQSGATRGPPMETGFP